MTAMANYVFSVLIARGNKANTTFTPFFSKKRIIWKLFGNFGTEIARREIFRMTFNTYLDQATQMLYHKQRNGRGRICDFPSKLVHLECKHRTNDRAISWKNQSSTNIWRRNHALLFAILASIHRCKRWHEKKNCISIDLKFKYIHLLR